uniref:(northern house mosquito) hypothetical protein n=1 Tax=Culex pipiens TaxID=7175 RepID=A0A8D8IXC0_CULPI
MVRTAKGRRNRTIYSLPQDEAQADQAAARGGGRREASAKPVCHPQKQRQSVEAYGRDSANRRCRWRGSEEETGQNRPQQERFAGPEGAHKPGTEFAPGAIRLEQEAVEGCAQAEPDAKPDQSVLQEKDWPQVERYAVEEIAI